MMEEGIEEEELAAHDAILQDQTADSFPITRVGCLYYANEQINKNRPKTTTNKQTNKKQQHQNKQKQTNKYKNKNKQLQGGKQKLTTRTHCIKLPRRVQPADTDKGQK